jgi:hypothetical protein
MFAFFSLPTASSLLATLILLSRANAEATSPVVQLPSVLLKSVEQITPTLLGASTTYQAAIKTAAPSLTTITWNEEGSFQTGDQPRVSEFRTVDLVSRPSSYDLTILINGTTLGSSAQAYTTSITANATVSDNTLVYTSQIFDATSSASWKLIGIESGTVAQLDINMANVTIVGGAQYLSTSVVSSSSAVSSSHSTGAAPTVNSHFTSGT